MHFETERLILRPWQDSDAEALYRYASDPRIGPNAGWPVHESVDQSATCIRTVLAEKITCAIVSKETGEAIGSVGLKLRGSELVDGENQAEVGYWIAVPFWGHGLMGEATQVLIDYAFNDLGLKTLWASAFEENTQSQRVQEKLGFIFAHRMDDHLMPLINQKKNLLVSRLDAPL